ncbi:cadherin-like domain-containing protein, partial [Mycolicibacterium sp. XJ1819]
DDLTAVLVDGPANGTLELNADGSFTYTPNQDFYGTDTFTYMANDGELDGNTATVTITVNPVNDEAPIAADDAYAVDEDGVLTVTGPGVLANDTDFDNDDLTAILVDGPANGTLTLNPDGSLTYTP